MAFINQGPPCIILEPYHGIKRTEELDWGLLVSISLPIKPDAASQETDQLKESESSLPYLSIVAASRNDNHGGDPLIRTQIFVNSFSRQCELFRIPAEIIIIDWNPVKNRPGLAAVLHLPPKSTYCRGRVITVPSFFHQQLKYSQQLPFFQMIAKNVGIARAKGQFILATNIDIVFSNELMEFISKRKLDPQKVYRVDRIDIPPGLTSQANLNEVLDYAWLNPIRSHRRFEPKSLLHTLYGNNVFSSVAKLDPGFRQRHQFVEAFCEDRVWQTRTDPLAPLNHLHTNACGDFTLLSRQGWNSIGGYPEFEAFSFNIDSMGLAAAHYGGYEEVSLLPPHVCFHIDHQIGSGWSLEGEKQLFKRIQEAGILSPEWPVLMPLVERMREKNQHLEFNQEGWGLSRFNLPEQKIGDTQNLSLQDLEELALEAEGHNVSALHNNFDLDRLTRAHERRPPINGHAIFFK